MPLICQKLCASLLNFGPKFLQTRFKQIKVFGAVLDLCAGIV